MYSNGYLTHHNSLSYCGVCLDGTCPTGILQNSQLEDRPIFVLEDKVYHQLEEMFGHPEMTVQSSQLLKSLKDPDYCLCNFPSGPSNKRMKPSEKEFSSSCQSWVFFPKLSRIIYKGKSKPNTTSSL